jgi:predicted XRE-type DNA-binding protein
MSDFDKDFYRKFFKKKRVKDNDMPSMLLRLQLLLAIQEEIAERDWTQAQAALALGVRQPRIAEINRVAIDKFSADLLTKYLARLGKEVTFSIRDAKKQKAS